MVIIGLTGAMGTGKSSLVRRIRLNLHWPVWDADHEIHYLYNTPDISYRLLELFPEIKREDGLIDRHQLRSCVQKTPEKLSDLEDILYPELAKRRHQFIQKMRSLSRNVIVLDIPLLLEMNLDHECDVIVSMICSSILQRKRILSRPGMTEDFMNFLLSKQFSLKDRALRSDILIETGLGKRHSWNMFMMQIKDYINGHS